MGEGADLGGRQAGAPLAEGALDVADEVRYLEIFGDVRRYWECFFDFFLEMFGGVRKRFGDMVLVSMDL
jgi:hypothetical protein